MNNTKTDTTDVYRYKITTRGKWLTDHFGVGHKKGDLYETIEFRGYYQTKQDWEPWHGAHEYMIVELQKLEAFIDREEHADGATLTPYLAWTVIRTKTFGEENE